MSSGASKSLVRSRQADVPGLAAARRRGPTLGRVTSDQRGSDAVKRGIVTLSRAAQALRDVVDAIDAGDVPHCGPMRNYLVGVVVTLDMLTAEQKQDGAR